jgi:hypothetical protein
MARGHPLALVLAANGVSERPELSLEDAALTRVVDALTRVFLQDVQDPVVRHALEAGSVVRRITGPLLVAMLGEEINVDELLSSMLDLPFVDVCLDGLVVHEAVRDAIAGFLRGSQPDRYRQYRRAAWRLLQGESRDAPATELWRSTADMLYLIDNPVVREAFFPSGSQPMTVERATVSARESITSIAGRHEGPAAVESLLHWWDVAPEAFSLVLDRDGGASGFFTLLTHAHLLSPKAAADPVARLGSAPPGTSAAERADRPRVSPLARRRRR